MFFMNKLSYRWACITPRIRGVSFPSVAADLTQWMFKVLYEVVATPLTYLVVGFLKRRENLDMYDYRTNFSPILLREAAPER